MKKVTAIILAVLMVLSIAAGAMGEENKIWQAGDTGEKVTWIQQRLKDLEYLDRAPTGIFDEETAEALQRFQQDHGLLKTGMADSITMKMLETVTETRSDLVNKWNVYYEEDVCYEASAESYSIKSAYAPMATAMPAGGAMWNGGPVDWNTEEYTTFESNRFLSVQTSPLSTFAADVDTSSYALFRRKVLSGERVSPDSIRIEEMLNYFHYDYAKPQNGEPFGVTVEIAPCPWNEKTKLMLIGLQAEEIRTDNRPGHNLVFLIDTSGSMYGSDRLDLVKRAFLLLLDELEPEDTVSIVAYASQDRVVIEGVPAADKTRIMEAISELEAGGATNGSAGINRAYEIAAKYYREGGVNRILLATDGDLNVGTTGEGDLANLVSEKKKAGISLTCLGVGMGNYKDTVKKSYTITAVASSIKLDKTATGLGVGETVSLKATTTPANATVTWTSSNSAVCTVSAGRITGKKVGTATITASSGKVKATCTVTVKAAEKPTPDLTVNITQTGNAIIIELVINENVDSLDYTIHYKKISDTD